MAARPSRSPSRCTIWPELRTIISRLSAVRGVIRIRAAARPDTAKATANTAELQAEHVKNAKKPNRRAKYESRRHLRHRGIRHHRRRRNTAASAGAFVLLGVHVFDTAAEADRIVDRICGLAFEDANGKMNVNPADAGAELLIVSQFTLLPTAAPAAPGFTAAARPETAVPLYERVIAGCEARGFTVRTRACSARDMQVASVNDGPVTILLDTDQL